MYILTSIVLSCLFRKQGVHMIILIKSIIRSVQNPWFERKWFQFLHLFWFNSAGEKRSKIVWKNNFDTNGRDHAESFILFHTELGMIKALPELWRKIEMKTLSGLYDRLKMIVSRRSLSIDRSLRASLKVINLPGIQDSSLGMGVLRIGVPFFQIRVHFKNHILYWNERRRSEH